MRQAWRPLPPPPSNTRPHKTGLDQPAGVGFSWGAQDDKDEADAARDAYDFLQAFFKAHPALQARPFFIVGESYGGHYTPALSYLVSQNNAALPPGAVKINLRGLGVGNGLTVPLAQYPEYATLAYNFTKEKLGHPVISLATYEGMLSNLKTCLPLIEACQNSTGTCGLAQSLCNNGQIGPYEQTGLNPYDFRIPCEVPGLCYDESKVTAFFNDAAIQKALGVDHQTTWQTCNYDVNGMFSDDWMKQFGRASTIRAPSCSAAARAIFLTPLPPPRHPPTPRPLCRALRVLPAGRGHPRPYLCW